MQQETFYSEEGCTQGDPSAMAFYALGTKPLVDSLAECTNIHECKQAWYADDSSAVGRLTEVKSWWQKLNIEGPKFGYFPKASKSILIVKEESLLPKAIELFGNTNVEITWQGQRHLGAVIGTGDFKNKYVTEKVDKWIEDITAIANITNEEPQAALSAYTKSICHRWVFVQRTIPNTSHLFEPLEQCIRQILIPAVVGRAVSDNERKLLSLPVRWGGLGIADPTETADREYEASCAITEDLAHLIIAQQRDLALYDSDKTMDKLKNLKTAKETFLSEKFDQVLADADNTLLKRCMLLNKDKGAGSWLTALPLKDHGFCLNKQEFRDAVSLRYAWRIPNTPQYCGCGALNSINHTLICAKGGFIAMRHNALRDLNAELQSDICKDVTVEPSLLPIDNEEISGTSANRAAPDISSRGLWSTFERSFFDVRVLHPNAPSYMDSSLSSLYQRHEMEKMKKYNSPSHYCGKGHIHPFSIQLLVDVALKHNAITEDSLSLYQEK